MGIVSGIDAARAWPELEQDAVRMAAVLRDRGVRPGDRVLFQADNSVGWVTALLALMHAGASIVLLDHRERADLTERLMAQAGVSYVVLDDDAVKLSTEVPTITLFELQVAAAGRPPGRGLEPYDATAWRGRPDGLLMCSSGSTGNPKLIVKTGESFLVNLERNLDQVGHVRSDTLVPLLPFPHQYGLSMVLIAWLVRCSLVVAPYRRLDRALELAASAGGTVFDAPPVTYRSMMRLVGHRPSLGTALETARMLCSGAAPLDVGLVNAYEETFGHTLLDSYGSTELGNVAFATLDNPTSCGTAVEGIELAIHDVDGEPMQPGEIGEIMVLTPDVMCGYLDESGVLAPVSRGWYSTGDLGYLDKDGNLFILGRKRAVHRMGNTLHPDIIESKIAELGCPAKLVALPDERQGCLLVAFVEDPSDGSVAQWRERMAGVLADYEMPNRIYVIDRFPVNRNGKPDGRTLEEMAAAA